MGPYLGYLLSTEEIKVRKGGIRMGCSLWLGVEQQSGSDPSSPVPGNWELGN